jgi:tRNA (guanine37-N1)-methyltransferase
MRIGIVSLFPEMFDALLDYGISSRAVDRKLIEIHFASPRDYGVDKHQSVDDKPYGGGPGMLMRVEPLKAALQAVLKAMGCAREKARVIYLSPQGRVLDTESVGQLMQTQNLVLICGRYEGIDERFIEHYVDEEISIGDYVLSGGELPAMVLLDALIRRIPGALGDDSSAEQDSFESGLLDCPHYTRPETVDGASVPEVLMSGDHAKIDRWRLKQSLGRTWQRRPDLLEAIELSEKQQTLLEEFKHEQKF